MTPLPNREVVASPWNTRAYRFAEPRKADALNQLKQPRAKIFSPANVAVFLFFALLIGGSVLI